MHDEERQAHAQPREVAVPAERPHDVIGDDARTAESASPPRGPATAGSRSRCAGTGNGYFQPSGVTPMLSTPCPLIELMSGFMPFCLTQCQSPTSVDSSRAY